MGKPPKWIRAPLYISYIYIYYTYIKYHVHKVVQHMILANVQEGDPKNQPTHAWFADKFQGCGSHCQSTLKLRFWCPNQSTIGESLSIHRGNPLWWISLFLISRRSWRNPRLVIPLLLNSFVGGFISFFLVTNRFFPEKHHPSANPNGAALLGRSRGALGLYQGS